MSALAEFMRTMQQISKEPTIGQRFMQGQQDARDQQEQELLMQELNQRMSLAQTAEERAQILHEIQTDPERVQAETDRLKGLGAVGVAQQETALPMAQAELSRAQTEAQYAGPLAQAQLEERRAATRKNNALAAQASEKQGYKAQSPEGRLLQDIYMTPEGPGRDLLIERFTLMVGEERANVMLKDLELRAKDPDYDVSVLEKRRDAAETPEDREYFQRRIDNVKERERTQGLAAELNVSAQLLTDTTQRLETLFNIPRDDDNVPIYPPGFNKVVEFVIKRAKEVGYERALQEAKEQFGYEAQGKTWFRGRPKDYELVEKEPPPPAVVVADENQEAYNKYRAQGMSSAEAMEQIRMDGIQTGGPEGDETPPDGAQSTPLPPAQQFEPIPPTPPPVEDRYNPYADEETRYGGIDETISTLRVDLADKTMTKEEAAQILKDLKDENRISQRDYVRAMKELRLGTWGESESTAAADSRRRGY